MRLVRSILCVVVLGLSLTGAAASVFTGTTDNSWNEAANWDPQGVPQATDDVSIPAGKSVVATGAVVCCDLNLAGNLTLGSTPSVRNLSPLARTNVSLTAEGDITLSGSAKLTVYAGQLADLSVLASTVSAGDLQAALYAHANVVSAKGTMTFGAGTTVVPNNDDVSGTPVIFRATDITVAAGATVNADGAGWGWFYNTGAPTPAARTSHGSTRYTYGPGWGSSYGIGGSYGGKGGGSTTRTYGFSFAPLMPGSPSGLHLGVANSPFGGGSVCLQASDTLTVRGTILARGWRRNENAGASGGGIWLCGDTVDCASAEEICADGESISKTTPFAAGGGGRIAVCEGMTTAELADMAVGTMHGEELTVPLAKASVNGGTNTDNTVNGAAGTISRIATADRCVHLTVVTPGLPTLQMEGLTYDEYVLPVGTTTFNVPEYAFLASDPGNVRYAFAGYVVSNATTQVAEGGADKRTISFLLEKANGPYTIYLSWTNREIRRAFDVPSAYGTFRVNGVDGGSSTSVWGRADTSFTAEFVPSAGCSFKCWSGSYPRAHTLGNPATCATTNVFSLTALVDGCAATGESASWNGGTGRWDDATKWSGGKVPTLLDDVTIASGTVSVPESFAAKSLTLSGGTLTVGATGCKTNVYGTVAGNVTLSGSAVLTVLAARPSGIVYTSQQALQSFLYDWANTIRIDGALTVGEGSKVQVANDPLTGLPVIFRVGSVSVASGGTLTANGGGFSWLLKTDDPIFALAKTGTYQLSYNTKIYATYGYGSPNSPSYYGGGHGGKCNYTIGSSTYGFENAPLLPGSPGGLSFWYGNKVNEPYGGGTVCVFAEGDVTVDGTVSALGVLNVQPCGTTGGAIWLAGTSVTVSDSATVTADGTSTSNGNGGAGGGGRILFAVSATSAMLDQLVDGTATPESLGLTKAAITSERVTVAGGVNTGSSARGGSDGTRYQIYDENATTTMTTTADPVEYIADGFVYGSSVVNYGTTYGVAAPVWGYNTEARTDARFAYAGYVASNATTQVASGLASDPTVSVSFVKPEGPYELRLKWGARQTYHVVTIADTTLGSVTKNGEAYVSGTVYWSPEEATDTLTAVPAAGCEFVCWRGDVPCSVRLNPTISVSAAAATRITAVFRTETAEAATYHWKSNVTGDWFDGANWDEGNFPWVKDDVVLKSGSCSVDSAFEVRSLTVTNGAALTIEDVRDVIVKGDLLLTSANSSLRIVSAPTDEANTWTNGATRVTVAGTFTVTNSATLYSESDEYTGGSPVFSVGTFILASNATVNAVSLGFGGPDNDGSRFINLCPGGSGCTTGVGGGYGGASGRQAAREQFQAGLPYGLALSPIHPGAPSGVASYSKRGGGLVRIHAARRMAVDGTIDASADNTSIYCGASGGGIWLTCEKTGAISFGPGSQLLAKGGHSIYAAQQSYLGLSEGGGGRIAVGACLTEPMCRKMIETGAYPGGTKHHVLDLQSFTNRYQGVTINLQPGDNWSDDEQYHGTFRFVDGTRSGLILFVR